MLGVLVMVVLLALFLKITWKRHSNSILLVFSSVNKLCGYVKDDVCFLVLAFS